MVILCFGQNSVEAEERSQGTELSNQTMLQTEANEITDGHRRMYMVTGLVDVCTQLTGPIVIVSRSMHEIP